MILGPVSYFCSWSWTKCQLGQGKEGNALKGQNTHMVTSSHMSWAEHITDLKRKLQFFLPLMLGPQKVGEGPQS